MAGRGGYAALPHSAVECPQQPDGYGVYGSQRTTNPYNPQLQQVQQPGGYGSQGTTNPYNPQLQQVQQPGGYSGYGSQGTTNPYNPQLQQVQQPGYCDPQQQYVQPPSYQSFLQCNLPESQQPQPPFNPSAGYVPPLANFSNQHSVRNLLNVSCKLSCFWWDCYAQKVLKKTGQLPHPDIFVKSGSSSKL